MQVDLIRLTASPDRPQLGVLRVDGVPQLCTLELPYKDNRPKESCIPEGQYLCLEVNKRVTTGGLKIPTTFEVVNVPNRAGILFHVGNTAKDTQGCILVGQRHGVLNSSLAVLGSSLGFKLFLDLLAGHQQFNLSILRA